jgi:acyl-coenzyme A synthetase/AMP-(fatty) acid ligase
MDTLVDLLGSFPRHGNKPLFWAPGEILSYADAHQGALALAGYLRANGLGPGDEVLITLGNGSAFPIALLGVAAAGCSVILADRDSSGQVLGGGGAKRPAAHVHDYAGAARVELGSAPGASAPLPRLPASGSGAPGSLPPREPGDLACILYTSGSSGMGRGVLKTHANLMVELADLADILARPGDRFLSVLPWSYIYGLLHHLLLPMYVGGTACHLRGYTPAELLDTVARQDVDVFVGVPALYRVLAGVPGTLRRDDLSWAVSSGAPLDATTAARIYKRLGWRVVEFYGSTESGGISFNPDKQSHGDSVGQAMPHIQIRGLPRHQGVGVLEVRGPTVSDWAHEGTGKIRLTDAEGWYATNDTGSLDSRGRLRLTGRVGRLIKVAGKRVSLDGIEAALLSLPGVMDATVSARYDRLHGEVPVADVVPAPGSGLSSEGLLRNCKLLLPAHQRPRQIRLCRLIKRRRVSKAPLAAAPETEPLDKP